MKKTSIIKRIGSLALVGAIVFLAAGCGNRAASETAGGSEAQGGGEAQRSGEETASAENGASGESGNAAMGRYVETVTDLSEYCSRPQGITKLSDGSLVITDDYGGFIVSKDNGVSWAPENADWYTELRKNNNYILDMVIAANGTIGVIYDDKNSPSEGSEKAEGGETAEGSEKTEGGETADGSEETEGGGAADAAAEESGDAAATGSVDDIEIHPVCRIIKPDGTVLKPEFTLAAGEIYISDIWISDRGRIFVHAIGGSTLYEVKEDGTTEKYLSLENRPAFVQFLGDRMIVDSYGTNEGILIYNLEKKEYERDEVLSSFISENYKNRDSNGGSFYDLYLFPGEDNVLYLAGAKGVHRHVMGGSAMEQVIDGSLSSFNNPANNITGMVRLENDEFMTLFANGKLIHYTYNPDIPTMPTEKVSVYSLKDNAAVRQAATLYQTANPELYVEYEVGMGEDNSVTREDALKKLNTLIMAGEGPDVLVLDDMPIDSYINKGLLLDLSGFLEGLTGENELFPNIAEAFKKDGKIYSIPCEIQLPMVEADKKYTAQMTDLKGIADAAEQLRAENPEGELFQLYSEKAIMRVFSMAAAPAFKTEGGELNTEAIREFLTQCKRIFDAQMEGVSEESIKAYDQTNEYYLNEMGALREDTEYIRIMDSMGYVGGNTLLMAGTLSYPYGYAELISLMKVEGFESTELIPMEGLCKNVFLPMTIAGINAASSHTEAAENFLKILLGKENQTNLFNGFAVNKAAFEESFIPNEEYLREDGLYGSIAVSDDEGLYVSLDIYWPDEAKLQTLRNWIEAASTPYIQDTVLEEAVYEQGISYMQGTKSLDEAVRAITEKVSIYMAE